jgi:hypothetical protein
VVFTGVGNRITAENRDEATILCHAGLLQWLLSFHFLNVKFRKTKFQFLWFWAPWIDSDF